MVILDTDHVSLLGRDSIEAFNIDRRLDQLPAGEIFVSIVTYEEQMRVG